MYPSTIWGQSSSGGRGSIVKSSPVRLGCVGITRDPAHPVEHGPESMQILLIEVLSQSLFRLLQLDRIAGQPAEFPVKTRTSRRCVDLDEQTTDVLARWRRRLTRDGLPHEIKIPY